MAATPHDGTHRVGEVEIAFSTTGRSDRPPVLLIAGLGAQLISWDGLCDQLADRGLFMIRFDNRDAGLSTHLGDGAPTYTLSDLAADTAGLINALGLGAVHVVGASMGGMVAQLLAIEHPTLVRSLTSIMSTTGNREVGTSNEESMALLLGPRSTERADALDRAVVVSRVIGSPAYPDSEERIRDRAAMAYDRAFDPDGYARQLQACLTAWDRTPALQGLDVPTLVIHGDADPLVNVTGGRATADAVPDSDLVVITGMGHDLPELLWPELADLIAGHVLGAEQALLRPRP